MNSQNAIITKSYLTRAAQYVLFVLYSFKTRIVKSNLIIGLLWFILLQILVSFSNPLWSQSQNTPSSETSKKYFDTKRLLEIQNQFNLAISFYNKKSYTISIPYFIKTLQLNNNHFYARYFLSLAFFKTGKNQEAIREMENLIRLNGPNRSLEKKINFFVQQQYFEQDQNNFDEYVWIKDYPNSKALNASSLQKFNPLNVLRNEKYQVRTPIHLAVNRYNELEVLDFSLKEFFKLDGDGIFLNALYNKNNFFTTNNHSLGGPWSFVEIDDNYWITDLVQDNIKVINKTGQVIMTYGANGVGNSNLLGPRGIAKDKNKNLYVVDSGNGRIQLINQQGVWLKNIGERGDGNNNLLKPVDVAYDTLRNQLYVLDSGNKKILVFSPEGKYITSLNGTDIFVDPRKMYLERSEQPRHLYVLDRETLFRYQLEKNTLSKISLHRSKLNDTTIDSAEFSSLTFGADHYLYLGNSLRQKIEVYAPVEKTYVNFPVIINGINTKKFPLVSLDISVKNLTGHPVKFLQSHNFSLYENNVALPFRLNSNPQVKRIVFLIEKSSQSKNKLPIIKTFSHELFNQLSTSDQIKVITYNATGYQDQTPFNNYKLASTEKAMVNNFTDDFEARQALLASLNHVGDSKFKNALVLLVFSPYKAKHFKNQYIEVLSSIKNHDIPVYVFYAGANTQKQDFFMLKNLSSQTGGKFYIYDNKAMVKFKNDINNYHNGVYNLEYITTSNPRNKGSFRKVAVNIRYKNNQGEDQLAGYPIPY